ncbi:MAG: hypothetical protein COT85_04115 [Chlamydiae bacterium CG10_big_fil_rev_8_21_14_0_10_42_34]|nr:MAG: hypothetical protein COT85_04115 [Chlamydiae bacterium CG10_big_fil_rev_8_21_14_0_10_42_34]
MTFETIGLSGELLKALADHGYTKPTPVQLQAIPLVLQGSDILAGSQTGTGKTASFMLPILQILSAKETNQNKRAIRALVLAPTRELAAQVNESVKTYGKYLPLRSSVVVGGVNIKSQAKDLRDGADILVATPGRLLDLVTQGIVHLSQVEVLVLDEADRMLDMGFIRDIRKILALLPKKRQNLLFSATFSDEIKQLADGFLKSPKMIEVTKRNTTTDLVTQVIYPVDRVKKRALLSHLISSKNSQQVLVFTRTKHGANRLAQQLCDDGISSVAIHGNKSQSARTKALADFKQGFVRVLVATDIAARGLDISQLPFVVNFELPNVPEDYVHRIGRTGRAGCTGEAASLVCIDEDKLLYDIERLLKRGLEKVVIAGFEPDPSIKAEPIPNGRMQKPQRNRPPQGNQGNRNQPNGRSSGPSRFNFRTQGKSGSR